MLLISKSYWFDKPRFVNERKLLLTTSTPSLGAQPNATITDHQAAPTGIAEDEPFAASKMKAAALDPIASRSSTGGEIPGPAIRCASFTRQPPSVPATKVEELGRGAGGGGWDALVWPRESHVNAFSPEFLLHGVPSAWKNDCKSMSTNISKCFTYVQSVAVAGGCLFL